jgi:iron complex transport system substrate-binding protein
MFRAKASQADLDFFFIERLVSLVDTRLAKRGVSILGFRFWIADFVMGSNRSMFGTALLALVLIFSACQRPAEVPAEVGSTPNLESTPKRVVTDDLERQVAILVNVKRVVSTAPSVTEMIFAVGGGDRLVGVTTFCDYPEDAKSIAKIGDTMNPNMESIIALKPDIVFVSTASQIETFMKTLEANGITVYVSSPRGLDGVYRNMRSLGEIMATTETAMRIADQLESREKTVRAALGDELTDGGPHRLDNQPLGTFVQISREPLFTIGADSFLNQIVSDAGGVSKTANIPTAYPKLSKETASALNPEVIILSDSPDNQAPNDAFAYSPAVKNGRVYKIDADIISRPGPRLVDALEQIARLLHPEKFQKN